MFLDENKFLVSRLEDSNVFSSEENSLLETKDDSIEVVEGSIVTA